MDDLLAPLVLVIKRVQQYVVETMSWMWLNVAYFVGIGLSAMIAKLVNHQFLDSKSSGSSWQPVSQSSDLTKPY